MLVLSSEEKSNERTCANWWQVWFSNDVCGCRYGICYYYWKYKVIIFSISLIKGLQKAQKWDVIKYNYHAKNSTKLQVINYIIEDIELYPKDKLYLIFTLYLDIWTKLKIENSFYKNPPNIKIKWCIETFWFLYCSCPNPKEWYNETEELRIQLFS